MREVTEAQTDDLLEVTQLVNGRDEAQPLTIPKCLSPEAHVFDYQEPTSKS